MFEYCSLFDRELRNYLKGRKLYLDRFFKLISSGKTRMINFIKKYLTNKIKSLNNEDALVFLENVFKGETPPTPTKLYPSFNETVYDEKEIEAAISQNTMRGRLYREVIRALLGDKAYIKQSGEKTLFSLSPIKTRDEEDDEI